MRSRCVGSVVGGRSCVVLFAVGGSISSPGGGDSESNDDVMGGNTQ